MRATDEQLVFMLAASHDRAATPRRRTHGVLPVMPASGHLCNLCNLWIKSRRVTDPAPIAADAASMGWSRRRSVSRGHLDLRQRAGVRERDRSRAESGDIVRHTGGAAAAA